jgi:hypothetical protein
MDLQLYLRVLWRFRLLVLTGLVIALVLGLLSFARISVEGGNPTFSYRDPEIWESRAVLWVTQQEKPYLRLIQPDSELAGADFSGLAALYSRLAHSDAVRAIMLREGPLPGVVSVEPVQGAARGSLSPFMQVIALSEDPAQAPVLATRQISALLTFLENEQAAGRIPKARRVVVKVLRQPTPAVLAERRSFTRPAVVFTTVLIVVLGLVFILENLRPRIRPLSQETATSATPDTSRRIA